jgi:predicted transcriptional regulator
MACARHLLARKLQGRRTTSKLPALIDLVFERPLVSSDMIAEALGVTPQAAHNPETSGRGRYRVWGNF